VHVFVEVTEDLVDGAAAVRNDSLHLTVQSEKEA
jgi:hypothetical protein